ncbi:beta-glucosidase 11-like isoform X2 [Sesbania bispinosa]|nr:beta-glucosidase 11-like isoform X2 [Sesbania bispinosa]
MREEGGTKRGKCPGKYTSSLSDQPSRPPTVVHRRLLTHVVATRRTHREEGNGPEKKGDVIREGASG